VPLIDGVDLLLADFQAKSPEGYPYVFVPPSRYDHIQRLRKKGKWSLSDARINVISSFNRQFHRILGRAGIAKAQFHDCRRTGLSNWLANGMSEYGVMHLAGHSKFETTHTFYLAVKDDLVCRARKASEGVGKNLLQICCSSAPKASKEKD
jgi:integrase